MGVTVNDFYILQTYINQLVLTLKILIGEKVISLDFNIQLYNRIGCVDQPQILRDIDIFYVVINCINIIF